MHNSLETGLFYDFDGSQTQLILTMTFQKFVDEQGARAINLFKIKSDRFEKHLGALSGLKNTMERGKVKDPKIRADKKAS